MHPQAKLPSHRPRSSAASSSQAVRTLHSLCLVGSATHGRVVVSSFTRNTSFCLLPLGGGRRRWIKVSKNIWIYAQDALIIGIGEQDTITEYPGFRMDEICFCSRLLRSCRVIYQCRRTKSRNVQERVRETAQGLFRAMIIGFFQPFCRQILRDVVV